MGVWDSFSVILFMLCFLLFYIFRLFCVVLWMSSKNHIPFGMIRSNWIRILCPQTPQDQGTIKMNSESSQTNSRKKYTTCHARPGSRHMAQSSEKMLKFVGFMSCSTYIKQTFSIEQECWHYWVYVLFSFLEFLIAFLLSLTLGLLLDGYTPSPSSHRSILTFWFGDFLKAWGYLIAFYYWFVAQVQI